MVVTLVILALSAVFFVSGKIRSDVVALCALVLLLLLIQQVSLDLDVVSPSLQGFEKSGSYIVGQQR